MDNSSSRFDSIKEQITVTRKIKNDGFESNSVVNSLKDKVNELLSSQEELIDLKSDFKVIHDSAQLREAEFSFQQKEYEKEIESLKKKNKELADALHKLQVSANTQQNFDVQVEINNQKAEILSLESKYDKWKTRSKEYRQKLNQLNDITEENEDLRRQLSANIDHLNKMQNDFDELNNLYKEIKNRAESQEASAKILENYKKINEAQISAIQNENEVLQKQLQNAGDEIEKLNNTLIKLTDDANKTNEENKRIREAFNSLSKDSEKMKRKIDRIPMLKSTAKANAKTTQELQDKIAALIEALDAETFEEAMEKAHNAEINEEKLENLKMDNKKLQNNLEIALEEATRSKREKKKRPEKSDTDDQLNRALQKLLHKAQDEHQSDQNLIDMLQQKAMFANNISSLNKEMYNQISDLHAAVCTDDRHVLRPLALAIIFTIRFPKLFKSEVIGHNALTVFASNLSNSIENKLRGIRIKITRLTEDLVQTKAALDNTEEIRRKLEKRVAALDADSSGSTGSRVQQKQKLLKKRIEELETELANFISPSTFDSLKIQLEGAIARESELDEAILRQTNEMKNLIREKESIEKEKKRALVDLNTANASIDTLKKEIRKLKNENSTLKSLTQSKTKEILALERNMMRIESENEAAGNDIKLVASENMRLKSPGTLHVRTSYSANPWCALRRQAKYAATLGASINPLFL